MSENIIDKLSIEVTSITKSATNALDRLQSSLTKIQGIVKSINKLKPVNADKLKAITENIESLGKTKFAKMLSEPFKTFDTDAVSGQVATLSDLGTAVQRLAKVGSDLRLEKLIDTLTEFNLHNFENLGKTATQVNRLAAALERLGRAEYGIRALRSFAKLDPKDAEKQVGSTLESIEKAVKKRAKQKTKTEVPLKLGVQEVLQGLELVSNTASKVAAVVSKAFRQIGDIASNIFALLSKGVGALVSPFTDIVKQIQSGIKWVTEFIGSIARILMYRAIRFFLAQMSDAIQTGVQNLYAFSRVTDGIFAASMDKAASSLLYLKNSIGAAVSPLINAFVPALELAIDKIVELLNYVNQLVALLTGATSWTKATKQQIAFAEATSAGSAAMKDFTMGFDELNVISQSSGGGGGATGPDYASMFETVPLDIDSNSWIGELKSKINSGDWEGIGQLLAEKFNSIFDSFDATTAGTKIGENIQKAIDVAYGFITNADFTKVGTRIAELLNAAIVEIDGEKVGTVLSGKLNAIIGIASGFLTTFDFVSAGKTFGDALYTYISTIDWSRFAEVLGTAIAGFGVLIYNTFAGHDWAALGVQIATAINNVDWSGAINTLGIGLESFVSACVDTLIGLLNNIDWNLVFLALATGIVALSNVLINSFGQYNWELIGIAVADGFNSINWAYVGGVVGLGLKAITDTCLDGLVGFFYHADWYQILLAMETALINLDWISLVGKLLLLFADMVALLLMGLFALFASGVAILLKDIGKLLGLILTVIVVAVGGIVNAVSGFISTIMNWISSLFTWLFGETEVYATDSEGQLTGEVETKKGIITGFIDSVKEFVAGLVTSVTGAIASLWTTIQTGTITAWNAISTFVTTIWNTLSTTISTVITTIQTTISTIWEAIKTTSITIWDGIKSGISTAVNTLKTTIITVWTTIKTTVINWVTEIKKTVTTKWDELKTSVVDTVKNLKDKVLEFWDNIKTGISDVITNVKDVINGFVNKVKEVYDKVVGFINGIKDAVNNAVNAVAGFFGGGSDSSVNVNAYASGGYPEAGELFVAREAGAELVGRIGSRTAVANNDQIVQGIYEGVLAAMNDSGGNGTIGVNVYLDGKQITSAVEKYQKQRGAMIYAGGVVNGV